MRPRFRCVRYTAIRFPTLSRHTGKHTRTRTSPSLLSISRATPELAVAVLSTTYLCVRTRTRAHIYVDIYIYTHAHTHTHTHMSATSLPTIHDQEELPSTDTATANIEFALTSREHAGRSIRLVWYPRNFAGGYEGKLDARRRFIPARTRAAFYSLVLRM